MLILLLISEVKTDADISASCKQSGNVC